MIRNQCQIHPKTPLPSDIVVPAYTRDSSRKSSCRAASREPAPDGTPCNGDTCGLLGRYPVTASGFHRVGKETERGWEQSEDMSTLLPSLMHYQRKTQRTIACGSLRKVPLESLQEETGLNRHTILRARRGERLHPRLLQRLRIAARTSHARRR